MFENIDINKLELKLKRGSNINLDDVSISEVEDIDNIVIDSNKSSVERILDFLLKQKNPYLFKVGGVIVKVDFSKNNVSADNCITEVFKDIYK